MHIASQAWRDIQHTDKSMFITRYGCLAQTHSFFSPNLPLVGPADSQRINVLGYMFIEADDEPTTDDDSKSKSTRRQTEHYTLICVDPVAGLWGGSYALYQDTLDENLQPVQSLQITFNVEAILREQKP
jgi:hypothetical protein